MYVVEIVLDVVVVCGVGGGWGGVCVFGRDVGVVGVWLVYGCFGVVLVVGFVGVWFVVGIVLV